MTNGTSERGDSVSQFHRHALLARATRRSLVVSVVLAAMMSCVAPIANAVSPTTTVRFDVLLAPRNSARLTELARAVATPDSPSYRHFWSTARFAAAFGATSRSVDEVSKWLTREGMSVEAVAKDRLFVQVTGPQADVRRAFPQVTASEVGRAHAVSLSAMPSSIASLVVGTIGLGASAQVHPVGVDRVTSKSTAHGTSPVSPSAACANQVANDGESVASGLSADEIASAYQMTGLYQAGDFGATSTIALVEFAPYVASDIAAFEQCYSINNTVTSIPIDGGPTVADSSSQVEAELDIEMLLGLAPDAHVLVYEGPNSGIGITSAASFDTMAAIVNDDRAQVISTSWGACEAESASTSIAAENTLFEQAALQGQTVLAAAGDSGSEDCYVASTSVADTALSVDDPASQPFVTSVGGTTLTLSPRSETVWKSSPTSRNGGSGGGGISTQWPMPNYQRSAASSLNVISKDSSGLPCGAVSIDCREVPDVSANAGTPYDVYCTVPGCDGGWTALGGTSAAAPTWAALIALANSSAACSRNGQLGLLNPILYSVASHDYGQSFNDVVVGNNDFTNSQGGLYPAAVGYDMASGLGTPIAGNGVGAGLVAQMCAAPAGTRAERDVLMPQITGVSPASARARGGARIVVDGKRFTDASVVRFGSRPARSFHLVSSDELIAIAPPGSGAVHVVVVTRAGASTANNASTFRYLQAPVIFSVTTAATAPGATTTATITGEHFGGIQRVLFGARSMHFHVLSATRIEVDVPAGLGALPVVVKTIAGVSTPAIFHYPGAT